MEDAQLADNALNDPTLAITNPKIINAEARSDIADRATIVIVIWSAAMIRLLILRYPRKCLLIPSRAGVQMVTDYLITTHLLLYLTDAMTT